MSSLQSRESFIQGIVPGLLEAHFTPKFFEGAVLKSSHPLEVLDPFTGGVHISYNYDPRFYAIQAFLLGSANDSNKRNARVVGRFPNRDNLYTEWSIMDPDNKRAEKPLKVSQSRKLLRSYNGEDVDVFIYEGPRTKLLNRLFTIKDSQDRTYFLIEDYDTGELFSVPKHTIKKPAEDLTDDW